MKSILKKSLVLIWIGALSLPAFARNISGEQRAVYEARKQYSQDNSDYENYTKQIEAQEQLMAQEQAKLNALRDKQSAAQQAAEASKADLDAKEKILNEVWEQRDK